MKLDDVIVVITGAAQGMGSAVAEKCVACGATTLLVDRDPSVGDLADRLACDAFVGDVADGALADQVIATAVDRYGKLNGLVNVAGIHAHGDAAEVTDESWDRVMSVNLTAPMLWGRAAIPAFCAAGGGSMVNFTSIVASRARPNCVAYVASKAGLVGYTRSVAVDFGHANVRANCLSPGSIDTPMFRQHEADGGADRSEQVKQVPLGRLGTTTEIAETCAFLLSDGARYINGVDLVVDGGRCAGT